MEIGGIVRLTRDQLGIMAAYVTDYMIAAGR